MSKRNGFIFGLLLLLLVVEIVIFAPKELGLNPASEPEAAPASVDDPKQPAAGQVMSGVYSIEANGESREWELWADKALGPRNNKDEWIIHNVRVKFYANNGVIYNVTGQTGHVIPVKNDIRIEGHVVTKSSNGYTFKTESVFYESKLKHLMSPGAVEMNGPSDQNGGPLKLTGVHLYADFSTNEISIANKVRARKVVKGDKVATITSQRATFSGKTNVAQFNGDVVMDVNSMRVTGPEAHFVYNPETHALDSIQMVGGIKVTDTDKFATSNSLSVNFLDDRMVFSGAPRVVQNGDELTGDEIVFLDGGHKVQVSNVRADFDPMKVQSTKSLEGRTR